MNPKVIFSIGIVLTTLAMCSGRAASNDPSVGKYQDPKHSRYIHVVQPYVHVHDNRELGQYRHIPNPYDGGYGPYSGLVNPYVHDNDGNYDKYTTTTTTTTTKRPTTTTTTTTTTPRPRISNYHEEGGWRIIRQEEEKKKHKYDYLYLTENGIYGEEKAHLRKDAGTAASGYYEYTGDDGEVYRVNYKSDERGFIPEADHIPTPPPIPEAIKRALEYNARKKEIHGALQTGQYEHRPGPARRQNMPTSDRALSDSVPSVAAAGPGVASPPPPTGVPQARFLNYNANNQYNPLPTGLGSVGGQSEQQVEQGQPPQQYTSQTAAPYEAAERPTNNEEPLPQAQPLVQAQPEVQAQQPVQELPQAQALVAEPLQQDQPQSDQPQSDQPQSDQPQPEPEQQQPVEEQPQSDQPQASEVLPGPEVELAESVAASERYTAVHPFEVAKLLKDEDNFEYATA